MPPKIRFITSIPGFGTSVCIPPIGIFLDPSMEDSPLYEATIEHETVHWEQYQRLGLVRWWATYIWYLFRYGYEKHPFEVEAYEKSGVR